MARLGVGRSAAGRRPRSPRRCCRRVLHGLVADAPEQVGVYVPVPRRPESRGRLRFHGEWTGMRGASVGSPPRTSVPDTVLDLCDLTAEGQVVNVVLQALQERRTTVARLQAAVERRSRLRHRLLLTDLLADAAEGAESALELRYLRDVERAHGLPAGTRQHQRRHPLGRDVRDVRYDAFATVVELDGRRGHDGAGRFRDMRRDNRAVVDGEAVLRYGWWDVVERACVAARQVGGVLGLRGCPDRPRPCPRCRRVPVRWTLASCREYTGGSRGLPGPRGGNSWAPTALRSTCRDCSHRPRSLSSAAQRYSRT